MLRVSGGKPRIIFRPGYPEMDMKMGHPPCFDVENDFYGYMDVADYVSKKDFENALNFTPTPAEIEYTKTSHPGKSLELDSVENYLKYPNLVKLKRNLQMSGGQSCWQFNIPTGNLSKKPIDYYRMVVIMGDAYKDSLTILNHFDIYVKIPLLKIVATVLNNSGVASLYYKYIVFKANNRLARKVGSK